MTSREVLIHEALLARRTMIRRKAEIAEQDKRTGGTTIMDAALRQAERELFFALDGIIAIDDKEPQ